MYRRCGKSQWYISRQREKLACIGECVDYTQVGNRIIHIFIARTEVNSYLCLKYFLKKEKKFRVFRSKLAYILIHTEFWGNNSEEDSLWGLRNQRKSIIWIKHLPMQRYGEGQIFIVVQNINTMNTSALATNEIILRTNCTCYPNLWLYKACHTHHVMENNI